MAEKQTQHVVKLTAEVKAKLDKMSKELSMPRSQCVNMLLINWAKANDK